MKILIEGGIVFGGGVETILRLLANYLDDKGCDVTVAADLKRKKELWPGLNPGIRRVSRSVPKNGRARRSPLGLVNRVHIRLHRLLTEAYLNRQNFDVAVAIKEGRVMQRMQNIRAKRRIGFVHVDYFTPIHWQNCCFATPEQEKKCMQRYDKILCVSEVVRTSVIQTIGDPGNLCIRYNPINVDRILSMAKEPCDKEKPAGKPLLVYVVRLAPEKQWWLLLEACALLREKADFELWVIGDGPDDEKVRRAVEEKRLSCVKILGRRENPFPYLRQADLFVSSSNTESYGLAVQEAFVLGVPVVAVTCPGIAESLDARFGMLVDNSAEALCAGMLAMLRDPDLLKSYRDAIARDYPAQSLYTQRLEAICDTFFADRP